MYPDNIKPEFTITMNVNGQDLSAIGKGGSNLIDEVRVEETFIEQRMVEKD